MCNLYSLTKGQAAIIALTRAMRDTTGNLPPLPGIFPDYSAPIIRNALDGKRELELFPIALSQRSLGLMLRSDAQRRVSKHGAARILRDAPFGRSSG
jgi:hypothetical protein